MSCKLSDLLSGNVKVENISYNYTIGCGRFLSCILPPAPLIFSNSLSDYPVHTLLALILEYSLPQS